MWTILLSQGVMDSNIFHSIFFLPFSLKNAGFDQLQYFHHSLWITMYGLKTTVLAFVILSFSPLLLGIWIISRICFHFLPSLPDLSLSCFFFLLYRTFCTVYLVVCFCWIIPENWSTRSKIWKKSMVLYICTLCRE